MGECLRNKNGIIIVSPGTGRTLSTPKCLQREMPFRQGRTNAKGTRGSEGLLIRLNTLKPTTKIPIRKLTDISLDPSRFRHFEVRNDRFSEEKTFSP